MRHSPVSIALLLGTALAFSWAVSTLLGSSPTSAGVDALGAGADTESGISQEELNRRVMQAQPGAIHNASWSLLMTIPHR